MGGLSAIAEAGDGTVLLEYYGYESYAPPGKGWSRPEKLPADIDAVAFNGRGERLAVWGGVTFDVRRPGDEKPSLRASLPTSVAQEIHATGSSGCDFLVDAVGTTTPNGTTDAWAAFLVRCKPSWTVKRIDLHDAAVHDKPNRAGGYAPTFDARGRPALFWVVTPPHGHRENPAWERIVYATVQPNGHLGPKKKVALISNIHELMGARTEVPGTREPTFVWAGYNGEIWQATPEGATRLSASKGSLAPDEGFDAISDEKGRAIVSWPAVDKDNRETTWISLPTAHGRRTERVGPGSYPILARAGKKLFVDVDLGGHEAIFARRGSSWKEFDLGENRWAFSGRTMAASGPRAAFAWAHPNYVSDQVSSTDLYTWIYPRP
jgi:hypothetical protein